MRDGEHQWRRFPFWYTVLALSEMDSAEARTELRYAAPALERTASRAVPSAVYGRRRHELAVRALNALVAGFQVAESRQTAALVNSSRDAQPSALRVGQIA